MPAPCTGQQPQVNFNLKHNNLAVGSIIAVVRPWREDELPEAHNFPVAEVTGLRRTANGYAIYSTTAGDVWFDRVSSVITEPAAAHAAAA